MAKTTHIQTNFTAGEVTPRLKGRPDVARYQNGAEIIENGIVSVHGGVMRRGGLFFRSVAKFAGERLVDIVRYVFNVDQAYLLEFGHQYVRFMASNGAVLLDESLDPLEITSPYIESQVYDIRRTQSGDTMFLFHPDVPTHRLRRLTGAHWVLDPVPWIAEPFAEVGHQPNARLTLSASTVGSGRTFTTSATAVPDAPTIGTAVALNAAANVHFTPPANTGGIAITHYTATSSPGGITASGPASPIRVPGLANNTAYTFTVTASNIVGTSSASSASNSVTPLASLPDADLAVAISPVNFVAAGPNGALYVEGPTAAATGGTAPYSYAWSVVGGSGITIARGDTATVRLRSVAYGSTNYVTLRCVSTDAVGLTGARDSNATVLHLTPGMPLP